MQKGEYYYCGMCSEPMTQEEHDFCDICGECRDFMEE